MSSIQPPVLTVPPTSSSPVDRSPGLRDEIGRLCPGAVADVSVLADDRGRFRLGDNEGTDVAAGRMLTPLFCLRAGKRYDAAAPILPEALAA